MSGIVAVPFLQARYRGNIEGNYEPAMSGLVYRIFPAGSMPRWRAIFFFDLYTAFNQSEAISISVILPPYVATGKIA
jgi:hypothetical protein